MIGFNQWGEPYHLRNESNENELNYDEILRERSKRKHPFHKIADLQGDALTEAINGMTTTEIIEWLKWNDRNGEYDDTDNRSELIELMTNQIING